MSNESTLFWYFLILTFCWILHDIIIHQEWKKYIAFIKWIKKLGKKDDNNDSKNKIHT